MAFHAFRLSFFARLRRVGPAALLACALALGLATPPAAVAENTATIRGTAAYRERIAVPPGTRLEIRLLDISRADAPARTLAELTLPNAGLPPFEPVQF